MAAVWHVLGVACGSMWISMGGPSMQGIGRWGQVLNVDARYRSSSQAYICSLFSGVHVKGRDSGRGGTEVRWGHEHGESLAASAASQPPLMTRAAHAVGGDVKLRSPGPSVPTSSAPSAWAPVDVTPSPAGKSAASRPRSSMVSYDRYRSHVYQW